MRTNQYGRAALLLLTVAAQISAGWAGQDQESFKRISQEGQARSELMRNLEFLTDAIGPRLTGSKNYNRAALWVAEK